MKRSYHITEMHCANCSAHVTRTIKALAPGLTVDVDLKQQHVTIEGELPEEDQLVAALAREGYVLHGGVGA